MKYGVYTNEVELFFPSPDQLVSLHATKEEAEAEAKRLTDEFDGDVQWWLVKEVQDV